MTQKAYDNIIDEEPSTLAKWIRYVTKLRLEDIGNADKVNAALNSITAASVSYDHTASGLAATTVGGAIDELATHTPAGVMMVYAGLSAPTGWLLCYGQSVLRSDYPALFAIISTTYGSADGTHFNLPDLRGRVVAGQDDMGGVSANRLTGLSGGVDGDLLGGTGGEEAHALVSGENGPHAHNLRFSDATAGAVITTTNYIARAAGGGSGMGGTATLADNTAIIQSSGSGTAHNNVQPTIILNYIIKV